AAAADDVAGDAPPRRPAGAGVAVRGRRPGGGVRAGAGVTQPSHVFRVERRSGGLAHLVVDHPARKLNVLDADAVASLESALTDLEAPPPSRVGGGSGKPGSFIARARTAARGAPSRTPPARPPGR